MRKRSTRLHLLIVVICLAVSASASGCSFIGSSTPTTTLPGDFPSFDQARDTAAGQKMVLQVGDAPADFRSKQLPSQFDLYPEPPLACEEVEFPRRRPTVVNGDSFVKMSESPNFQKSLASSSVLYKRPKDLKIAYEALTNPNNFFCLQRLVEPVFFSTLRDTFGVQEPPTNVKVELVEGLTTPDSFVVRATGTVTIGRITPTAYLDVIYLLRDRSQINVLVGSLDGAPPIDVERSMAAVMRDKQFNAARNYKSN